MSSSSHVAKCRAAESTPPGCLNSGLHSFFLALSCLSLCACTTVCLFGFRRGRRIFSGRTDDYYDYAAEIGTAATLSVLGLQRAFLIACNYRSAREAGKSGRRDCDAECFRVALRVRRGIARLARCRKLVVVPFCLLLGCTVERKRNIKKAGSCHLWTLLPVPFCRNMCML